MITAKTVFKSKEFWLVFLIWGIGLFLRTYRLGDLLGFYYDQGRDALKAAEIISFKDLSAVGPTTGLSGIFLGPFWFYLIAPFYWLGGGNPAVAAGFIGLIDSLTVVLFYYLGKRFFNRKVGFLSAFFWAFSYYLVRFCRWFSNPSPLPLVTLLLIWGLAEWLINKKDRWFLLVCFCLAVSLQLEAASAVFYLPAVLILALVFKTNIGRLIKSRWFWLGAAIFLAFLLPQAAFEVKNNLLMTKNLVGFFRGRVSTDSGQSWTLPTGPIIGERLSYYYQSFFSRVDPNLKMPAILALVWFLGLVLFLKTDENKVLRLCFIFLIVPLVALFFFVGNYGNLYDYYLSGFWPVFILLFAYFLTRLPWWAALLVVAYFLWQNLVLDYYYLIAGVDGPTHISLGNQKQVIDWVCQDAGEEKFNVDTYVPPVIPYAWDYLWFWYGGRLDCYPEKERTERLYTVWEVDPPHPERLASWLERQAGIGTIEEQARFGGIGVERRRRVKNE